MLLLKIFAAVCLVFQIRRYFVNPFLLIFDGPISFDCSVTENLAERDVANSSPQTVVRACICFDIAKFSANVLSHVIFRLLQIQVAALFRSLHSAYLLLGQLRVTTLHFLVFSLCTAFLLFLTPQLIVG